MTDPTSWAPKGDLPWVWTMATPRLSPNEHPDQWAHLVAWERQVPEAKVPWPATPVGDVEWVEASDCTDYLPEGCKHYRFWLHHTR